MRKFISALTIAVLPSLFVAAVLADETGRTAEFETHQTRDDWPLTVYAEPQPRWVTSSMIVPVDRHQAMRKLFYLSESVFLRQPDDVAVEVVSNMGKNESTKLSRAKLNEKYRDLLEAQIRSSDTEWIRGRIRLALAKRDARTRRREQRLLEIAEELASLQSDTETKALRKRVSEALRATGYVSKHGKVLPIDEAFPPLGLTR